MRNRFSSVENKKNSDADRGIEAAGMDDIDVAILRELYEDARIPRAELARRVRLSAPSVADRIQRMEDAGIIRGYHARIDPARLGYALTILIRARPSPGRMDEMIDVIRDTPQIVRCERVSGEDCFVAWAHVRDIAEMEAVIDRLTPIGATNTALVQSEPVAERVSGLLGDEPEPRVSYPVKFGLGRLK